MDYEEISRPYRYREWRNSLAALANRLEISPAGVGYAVKRGEAIAMRTVTSSSNEILTFLRALYIRTQGGHTPKGEVEKIYWVCYLIYKKKETSCKEIA